MIENDIIKQQMFKEGSILDNIENKNTEEITETNKPKSMTDLASVKVVLVFSDNSGFVVPLSTIQGAFLVRSLGFAIDKSTGELSHYTDLDLNNLYHLFSEEDLKALSNLDDSYNKK